ncbi:MAG: M28 family peptidase [Thermomicrobiales bacterium]|nr:M28 family peptidase [Thermomicrobiales bacterium]MCO5220844.1 M28 family peptidase [Thermomicrobiales bacterium]
MGIFAILIVASAVWIVQGDPEAPTEIAQNLTGTPAEIFDFDATPPPPTQAPSPTFPPEDTPTTGPTQPQGICNPLCLARMPSDERTGAFLMEFGAKVTYEHDGQAWVSVDNRMLAQFESDEFDFALVENVADTSQLYVLRLPEGVDRSAIESMGTIVDGVSNQFLVDIPGPPPYVRDIVNMGISIEKLPPLLPVIGQKSDLPAISDPGVVAESISVGQLKQRILDLEAMGGVDGALGSREYAQVGNVKAAEYLYRRLASYGLDVWYEDFIGDNGRLLLNVVGEIPGNDPSKIYLMTAHFDSIATDTNDPVLAPGALDNGSGIAVLLETARALSGYQLEHPVHIAFFNAEEYAMQGAHEFARHATTVESRPYAGAFNVDSVGASVGQNQLYVNANQSSLFLSNLLVDVNDRWGLGIAVWPSMSDKITADDTELNNFGIPAIMVASVLYGDPLINQSKDTVDAIDMWYLQAVGQLVTIAMANLVMPGGT